MRTRALLALAFVYCLPAYPGYSRQKTDHGGGFRQRISKEQTIDHALNRLTFGPRPGDADRVRALGLKRWIDLELHPERIRENPVLETRLKDLDTLQMSAAELVRNYPEPQMALQMLEGRLPFPADPDRKLMIERVAGRFERRQSQGASIAPVDEASRILTPAELRALRSGPPARRLAAFEALPHGKQDDLIAAVPGMVRQALLPAAPPELRRRIDFGAGPRRVVTDDLAESKILRAVYSNRQLEEVLTDFWFNHFNVFVEKGADHYLVTGYERDAIRPHVLGKFRDLLEATATSPAMLFYLDNWQSAGANSPAAARQHRGINENYGRELLELHTLGVDGGYTQKDVTEVARCFTGWTIQNPQRGGGFTFNPRMHDQGEKAVLGVTIPAGGGIEDGEKVLDILAGHPSTAHFISLKLARRFVADNPPPALVGRMARTFLKSGGDLRAVMKTMLESREFQSAGAYRAKMKPPLELVVSAVRAVDGEVDYAAPLVDQVAQLGEPLYGKLEPTGYSTAGAQWVSAASLLGRMNFALRLARNHMPGVKVTGPANGIELGSPEFQKH